MSEFLNNVLKEVQQPQIHKEQVFAGCNISSQALAFNDKHFGGLIGQSFFVAKECHKFGEITLLPSKSLHDKIISDSFSADVYTPRAPEFRYSIHVNELQGIADRVNELNSKYGDGFASMLDASHFRHYLDKGVKGYLQQGISVHELALAYCSEKGIELPPVPKSKPDLPDRFQFVLDTKLIELAERERISTESSHWGEVKAELTNYLKGADDFEKHIFDLDKYYSVKDDGDINLKWREVRWIVDAVNRQAAPVDGIDTAKTAKQAIDVIFANEDQYNAWVAKLIEPAFDEMFLETMDEYGEVHRVKATVDAVVDNYKSRKEEGEGVYAEIGTLRAAHAAPLGSLDSIVSASKYLVSKDEMEEEVERIDAMFDDILDVLEDHCIFDSERLSMKAYLIEDLCKCEIGDYSALKESFDYPPEIVDQLDELLSELSMCKTEYFESKLYEHVPFGDFNVAIVSSKTEKDVVDSLKGYGLKVYTYPHGDTELRQMAVNKALFDTGMAIELNQKPKCHQKMKL